jgi:glutathione S-transferase
MRRNLLLGLGGRIMLTLYFAPGASSFAPHIALHEIGVPFEARPMSFKQKDMRAPSYLALNPEGKVPTLVVDGRPLTEVAAILFYLAKRFPDAGLLPPDDIEAEAQAVSWMSFIASTLHPARKRGLDYAKEVYGIADRRLGNGWAVGRYSIADIHLFRLYWRLANSLHPAPETFPNLTAHYARMMARPAVQRTIEVESTVGYELPA